MKLFLVQCNIYVFALRTCEVSNHFHNRQCHQQVSHDLSESISDVLWA